MTRRERGVALVIAGAIAVVTGLGWATAAAIEWATHPKPLNSFSPMRVFESARDGQAYSYPNLELGLAPTLAALGAAVLAVGLVYLAAIWRRSPV